MTTVTPIDVTGQTTGPITPTRQIDTNSTTQEAQQPKVAAETKEEALSPKFAALARQQKMLRETQRALAEQKRAIETEKQAISQAKKEAEDAKAWKERLKQDPYGVMLETGLTADQVASLMLNQPNPVDQNILLLRQQLAQTQEELQKLKSSQEQSYDEAREMAKRQMLHEVNSIVNKDESFKFVKACGDRAKQDAVDYIEAVFNTEGVLLDLEEALKDVEAVYKDEALKLSKLIGPLSEEPQKQQVVATQQPQQPTQKQSINTLSNRMVPSTTKPMTAKEKRERAILAFQGKLTT